ncbi:sensor histidine kinase [Lentzea flaviverrucosa]|uniref:histidine kinase n=1 Tax=Lentzea flaviverrucosa TaxID=200379 RepID=A0A1H9JYL7_9PSEU|nr:HAMP domain-containing sensor histidine kinase [Lentzea flaviverrucosa]RDI26673.1 signal transduction histidine kinase [Lentzea flaviverrucosa]SEQ91615.1 Signal transduction histidine kinase [Lentzea flaviverrucosa]
MKLTLRCRVTLSFGFGLLVVTSVLAFATWNLASGYMLRQREASATRQAEVNVRLVERSLASPGLGELLTGLTTGPDSSILVLRHDGLVRAGRVVEPSQLPAGLVEHPPGTQRITVDGLPMLAVARPVAGDAVYVELFGLQQLNRTFAFLSAVLIAGTVASALLGAALGSWASKRALKPLAELNSAAGRIAGGDLHARLPDQDDPDLAALAAKFNSTAHALEQRALRDARFASDVSHELRSPLTTMVNAGAVLRRRREHLPGTAGTALELLTSEVDRFARMVVDLLEISRADQTDDYEPEELDLSALVRNVIATRWNAVPVEAGPVRVLGDRRRLDRVLANLVENAERHAGGAIFVAVSRTGDRARVEVEDDGPGVPEALREQIFERFARGRPGSRGDDTGSGLGLALVREHVQRHHGRVWVEDRFPRGARFVVELPALTKS